MADFMTNIKAVSRQDLFHDDASSADGDGHHPIDDSDEAVAARAALEALLARDLGLDLAGSLATKPVAAPAPEAEEPAPDGDGTAEFSFRLFSSSSGKKKTGNQDTAGTEAAAQTVVLTDDTIDAGEGGLVNASRPLSVYIADAPTPEQLAQYAVTAVDGTEIRAQASADRRNAWGWEVPWRARTVVRVTKTELRQLLANALPASVGSAKVSTAVLGSLTAQAANTLPRWAVLPSVSPPIPTDTSSHKCRPGKKRRILLRQRQKARAEKETAAQAQKQTKEEHLLEKKKRLNRLKKLRKREKKREEKTTGGSQGGGDGNSSDGSNET